MSLLEARDLVLAYGPRLVLEGASLSVQGGGGRVVGLRGPNGAGKSTFLKACLGLHAPRSGELRLLGARPGSREFGGVLPRLGYLPQARPAGPLRMSVAEVVELGRYGRLKGRRRLGREDKRAVEAALEAAGVASLRARAVQELSGGQYQRVALARALAGEPELLLLDEPSSHLDAGSREAVVGIVRGLAREGRASLLIVSHDEELLSLCGSFLEFSGGRAEARGA